MSYSPKKPPKPPKTPPKPEKPQKPEKPRDQIVEVKGLTGAPPPFLAVL